MSNLEENEVTISTPICVRVQASEYKILKNESEKLNKSLPTLLRNAYFKKIPTKVLMNEDDVAKIKTEMNRMGNNLNQIAKQLNAGIQYGWNTSIDAIREQLRLLNKHLENNYGLY